VSTTVTSQVAQVFICLFIYCLSAVCVQEIDSLLAGGLTSEDEDDVLKELEQIVKVRLICIYLFIIHSSFVCNILIVHWGVITAVQTIPRESNWPFLPCLRLSSLLRFSGY